MDPAKTYYNVHCHVFNLQAIFSEETRDIIRDRLAQTRLSDGGVELVMLLLRRTLDQQGLTTALLRLFDPRKDKSLLEFVRVATLPSMDAVTDWLMNQTPEPMTVCPLMMDITSDGGDTGLFDAHYAATLGQMDRYPGRVLPFVAVSPLRKGHGALAGNGFQALVGKAFQDGFAGLKLYPSLGYTLADVEKALQLCHEAGKPVMQHCSRGGFYASERFIDHSEPTLWEPYLRKYRNLKVCFGHFGGEQDFLYKTPVGKTNWTADILYMMKQYPGQVYADVSYHSILMQDEETYNEAYLARLFRILENKDYEAFVLWGSDSFLVRQAMSEARYLERFQVIGKGLFDRIASENPRRYLFEPV